MPETTPTTGLYRRFDGYDDLKVILDASDEQVLTRLGGPTLIRIAGTDARPRARFVSCLLHGNEDSGYRAVLALLRTGARFPFDLWVLIGNVRAAMTAGWFAHRYLDDQEDFNRVWGLATATTPLRRCAAAVLAEILGTDLEAGVDFHNNSGRHPPYTILPTDDPRAARLAAVCFPTVLRWHLRAHTMMQALAPYAPAVAVACGQAGLAASAEFAAGVLDRFLGAAWFDLDVRPERLFDMRAKLTVLPEVRFTFGGSLDDRVGLVLRPGLDRCNFRLLDRGTVIGRAHPGAAMPLRALDMDGVDVTETFFALRNAGANGQGISSEVVVVAAGFSPVMVVCTVEHARKDCLWYITHRRGPSTSGAAASIGT